jgi:rhodanese-related sulfurtransferase
VSLDDYARSGDIPRILVDLRDAAAYREAHIPGAFSIPTILWPARVDAMSKMDVDVVLYCACPGDEASREGAAELIAHGKKNVFVLLGGWNKWVEEKRATRPGDQP